MPNRKLPLIGSRESVAWCKAWDNANHQEKLVLCKKLGVSYQQGKDYRSACKVSDIELPAIPAPQQKAKVMTKLTTDWGKMETALTYNDTQNPYQDKSVLALVEQFMGELQPDYVFANGDVNDFYPLSKFDKNPERLTNLQGDLDNTSGMFTRQRALVANARMVELDGNHEDRLRRYLWSRDPALSSLRCLELNKLLGLDENEISHSGYEEGILINGVFLIIHGNICSVHSSYTAKRMYEKHGGCGIGGHTHRGGSYYKKDRFGTWGWWENFCLCDLDPDYIQNPNWQHGFSLIHFKKKRFYVEQVPIIDGKFIYGGRIYGGDE